ncbi:DUF2304 domain-containing protein [Schaalia sp. 19OD2882]|uniref:DUF2304 domain-containing protein n=1 Tax=Schaalia sp. 19OD2882 TaxID=2794089 RepID=UPI001C1ECE5C|nr:DUF2304 domain-containing protein [Schaalia sp. 19OD2882]QWW20258.1 DUF2304 domain-containing protein [Schaalia sp. 19OD2882]
MPTYWIIKGLLLLALALLAVLVLRPVRTAKHLAVRRLGMLAIIVFACFAVLFPGILNHLATFIGVEKGINLLVYTLVLALFMQMASSYRRDAEAERRLTRLARAIALSNVRPPKASPADQQTPAAPPSSSGETPGLSNK